MTQCDSEASTVTGGLLQLQKQKSTAVSSNSGLQVKTNNQQQSSTMPLQVLQKQTNPNVIQADIYGMKQQHLLHPNIQQQQQVTMQYQQLQQQPMLPCISFTNNNSMKAQQLQPILGQREPNLSTVKAHKQQQRQGQREPNVATTTYNVKHLEAEQMQVQQQQHKLVRKQASKMSQKDLEQQVIKEASGRKTEGTEWE